MKQIQGSVRVKIKEYIHAWSEFLFVSLLVIFNFFPQINHYYYFTSLHGLQDVGNQCAHLGGIELKTGRKKFHISAFPMYYSLYIWIAEHEITKLKKCIFASNPEKRTHKQAQKDMTEMRMRYRHLFCTRSHHNVPYE